MFLVCERVGEPRIVEVVVGQVRCMVVQYVRAVVFEEIRSMDLILLVIYHFWCS